MAKPHLGTPSWAARDHGALSPSEQAGFVVSALNQQMAQTTAELLAALRRQNPSPMSATRSTPDSQLARDAFELAANNYTPGLIGHCLRSWQWADLFAQRDDITYDPELLYVSALLHDMALTRQPTHGHCFAVDGGRCAREQLLSWGQPDEFAARVEEVIALHMNIHVPLQRGPEAHLLHAATHLDVAGTRMRHIPTEHLRTVVAQYPRDGFAAEFGQLMRTQAAAAPRSRAALAWRTGLSIPLNHNRLDKISGFVPPVGPDEPVGSPVRLPTGLTGVEGIPQASATETPVLLLHGMMGGAWQFSWFQRALTRVGYRSLAINYRAHHGSQPSAALGRVGVREYLKDALDACAYLGTPPIVVGQSMGGLIAQLLAAQGAVRAAVLVCALPPGGVRWKGARNPRRALRHLPAVLTGRPIRPHRGELDDLIFNQIPADQRRAYFARQVPESGRAATEIAYGAVDVDADALTCPVLSISAAHDRLVYPHVGEALAHRYRGDHLRLDDAGHYALVGEPGWEHLAEQIISWLNNRRLDTPKR
ncbi:MAG TPA: alpha/beta fold hydrolase [Mycobacterium sp.]|uniref:alpha/beta fold hydrolase n=1 Tax=Mycobacterium sp. TaxID=1785 RepID=UPI002CF26663|nr:alpha/beta fold hydrolase [Mycobacterium sp.]HME75084.1 alpha/beta fold hydrolase [Mycobacterium sp.]